MNYMNINKHCRYLCLCICCDICDRHVNYCPTMNTSWNYIFFSYSASHWRFVLTCVKFWYEVCIFIFGIRFYNLSHHTLLSNDGFLNISIPMVYVHYRQWCLGTNNHTQINNGLSLFDLRYKGVFR